LLRCDNGILRSPAVNYKTSLQVACRLSSWSVLTLREISLSFMSFLDDCRVIQFQGEIQNMILTNHVVQSYRVANQEICKIQCYMETKCVSYNYGRLEDGSFLCEINDKHHLQVPLNEFMARDGFIFNPILVSGGTLHWYCASKTY